METGWTFFWPGLGTTSVGWPGPGSATPGPVPEPPGALVTGSSGPVEATGIGDGDADAVGGGDATDALHAATTMVTRAVVAARPRIVVMRRETTSRGDGFRLGR